MIKINITNQKEVAYSILTLIKNLEIQFGKTTLSQILYGSKTISNSYKHIDADEYYGCLSAFSLDQIKNLIEQLISQEYLVSINVGLEYEMMVIKITEKAKMALDANKDISLNLPKVYVPEFSSADSISIIDQNILTQYYDIKVQLKKLEEKEEELKNIIKNTMLENNLPQIHTAFMDIFCKKIERVIYTKEKVELYVPTEILDKIKTVKESVVLTTKLK
ncbi:hypothetical protein HYY69_08215 [Candidatus Woesearchaeota archaeon]|nr:hypothetical protein [Candidatus Woesearchaeota archaeon]